MSVAPPVRIALLLLLATPVAAAQQSAPARARPSATPVAALSTRATPSRANTAAPPAAAPLVAGSVASAAPSPAAPARPAPARPATPVTTPLVAATPARPRLVARASSPAPGRLAPARLAPVRPPCMRPSVEVRRVNGRGAWSGPLADCAGRPTAEAMAAFAALAAPTRVDALGDLAPWVRAVRRLAPAAGWSLAETAPRRASARALADAPACPAGQEPVIGGVSPVMPTPPERGRPARGHEHAPLAAPNARRAARPTRPRVRCAPIPVARDPHTHDAVLTLGDGTQARALHPRLVSLLSSIALRFPSRRVEIISGYRPSTNPHHGSRHAHARAIDFRIAGVSREALRDAARALPDAGVGYYPNSVFVHLDVRDPSEGPARWTDYSGHGERARYGNWPPRDADVSREVGFLHARARDALELLRLRETPAAPEAALPREPAATENHENHDSHESEPALADDARAEEEASRELEAGSP